MKKFVLKNDGSLYITESEDQKDMVFFGDRITTEIFIKYGPYWMETVKRLTDNAPQLDIKFNINFDALTMNIFKSQLLVWQYLETPKEFYAEEDITELINLMKEGQIFVSVMSILKGIKYFRVVFINKRKEQETIWFARSKSSEDKYYLIKKNENKMLTCQCKSFRYRKECSHIEGLN